MKKFGSDPVQKDTRVLSEPSAKEKLVTAAKEQACQCKKEDEEEGDQSEGSSSS